MDIRQIFINAKGDRLEIGADKVTPARISIGKLREAIQANLVLSGPGMIEEYMPNSEQLAYINQDCQQAVRLGQVIDFGYWPNDLIKSTSQRAGKLYNDQALGHPFSSSWLFLHSWDSPLMNVVGNNEPRQTAYLVSPNNGELGCGFEALELEAFIIAGKYTLGIGDRVGFTPNLGSAEYNCTVRAMYKRFPIDDILLTNAKGIGYDMASEMSDVAAACNVIDPLMTALMILNTRGVKQETIPAPERLNRRRSKQGRAPIPPYRKVDSRDYVTAFQTRQERLRSHTGEPTGHHASPAPHIRIGHWRHYQTGQRSFIRDTLVNVPPELREQFQAKRSHYKAE